MRRTRIRMPKSVLPKPRKIFTRGIYECLTLVTTGEVKHRDYGKRVRQGRPY